MHFTFDIGLTVAGDIVAFSLVTWLLLFNKKNFGERDEMSLYFSKLLYIIMVLSVSEALIYIFDFRIDPNSHIIAMILPTLHEVLITIFTLVWLAFVNFRLYHNKAYIKRRFWINTAPLLIITFVCAFLSVLFYFTVDINAINEESKRAVLVVFISYALLLVLRFYYFISSIRRLVQYQRQSGAMTFFKVSYLFVPIIAGAVLTVFYSRVSFRILGFAVGVALLYYSMYAEKYYIDEATGFYNAKYIEYLIDFAKNGKREFGCRMHFKFKDSGSLEGFKGDFKKMIPEDCEIIRYSPDEIIVLALVSDRALSHMITEDIKEMAEESSIAIETKYEQKDEAAATVDFLGELVNEDNADN